MRRICEPCVARERSSCEGLRPSRTLLDAEESAGAPSECARVLASAG